MQTSVIDCFLITTHLVSIDEHLITFYTITITNIILLFCFFGVLLLLQLRRLFAFASAQQHDGFEFKFISNCLLGGFRLSIATIPGTERQATAFHPKDYNRHLWLHYNGCCFWCGSTVRRN